MSLADQSPGSTPGSGRLKKTARIRAYLLLAAIILSLITGWGITRTEAIYKASLGLIDRGVADSLHRALQIPMAAIFLTHVLVNFQIILSRRFQVSILNVVLIVLGILLLGGVIYMESL